MDRLGGEPVGEEVRDHWTENKQYYRMLGDVVVVGNAKKEQSRRCARMVLRFVCAVEATDCYLS